MFLLGICCFQRYNFFMKILKKIFFTIILFAIVFSHPQAVVAEQKIAIGREAVMEQALGSAPIEVSEKGKRLARMLDGFDVEHRWLAYKCINWETGKNERHFQLFKKPHCSSFVAAVAKKLGIYMLRPPTHREEYLANAQNQWLEEDGGEYGWKQVDTCLEAQKLANKGNLVVASYENPDPRLPGHIAIVRPYAKTEAQIREEGPQIIQAGKKNYNSTSLKTGFKKFCDDVEGKEILYFSHETDL